MLGRWIDRPDDSGKGRMTGVRRFAQIVAALIAAAPCAAWAEGPAEGAVPRVEWRACPWTQGETAEARCGDLVVPQSRRAPDGSPIRVFFAIYHTTAAAGGEPPLPDPIVVVPGGPGALFNPPVAYVMNGLAELRRRREIIIIDQRGVGRSVPRLACEPETQAESAPRPSILQCLARLKQRGVDPTAFNTEETARDLADLRLALKLAAWNPIGASYGSRVVLRLAQIDPAGTRAVVSMASLPLAPSLSRPENQEGRRALLDRLFADCAAEPACEAAYGNLAFKLARIRFILRRTAGEPPPPEGDATLGHLRAVERRTRGIERALIARLDWSEELPKLPRAIAELNDFLSGTRPLDRPHIDAIYGVDAKRGMPPIDDTLIFVTTRCPEDVLPAARPNARGERADRRDACSQFAAEPVPDTPPSATPPLLVLTGAYDIRTLSIWSEEIGARFPGAVVARMGDAGHDVSYRHPCANSLMNAFVADPQAKLDLACVARHTRPKFEVPEAVR